MLMLGTQLGRVADGIHTAYTCWITSIYDDAAAGTVSTLCHIRASIEFRGAASENLDCNDRLKVPMR
ncbi:Hypothetical predicted protein [Cloeon dipterum]|uniref:Uncharacterized protein n=1 Tax=Cloeon dipterum TaxID=197152 RepID=A0A8S1DKD6_9INSE|nr:Hypothetical predicted protein [Cloeon dipterum]